MSEPVWKGPEVDGITFSLLSRFLCCRERFRILVVKGLKTADTFNHRVEYGVMWHVCEEAFSDRGQYSTVLVSYSKILCMRYPTQQEQIEHWYNVCKTQFPLYVDYWRGNKDKTEVTHLLQEQVFDIPYSLPSGRSVRLRGKWDGVDQLGTGDRAGIYLFETKTRGDIREEQLRRQLGFDLQTMLYLVALSETPSASVGRLLWNFLNDTTSKIPIKGIRYNVIRRPLSGGKGTIVRHKPTKSNPHGESKEDYYRRLGIIIQEDPGYYFMRWQVEITQEDIDRFKRECLEPILEQLCEWWEQVSWFNPFHGGTSRHTKLLHFRMPYGIYNPLLEGNPTELDEYLQSGSTMGLRAVDNLFPELE